MTDRIMGMRVRVNPEVPPGEVWICNQLPWEVQIAGAEILFTERLRILCRITNFVFSDNLRQS